VALTPATILAPAVSSCEARFSGAENRVIHLNSKDPPLLVGSLPSHLELPCSGGTRDVHLSYLTLEHIRQRRENERPEHLALVLSRLAGVVAAPTHLGCLSGQPHKLDLWAWDPDDFSGVLVSVKCLSGETRVSTAFPLGRKTLRKHMLKDRLKPIRDA
jgi:hypothetical protein